MARETGEHGARDGLGCDTADGLGGGLVGLQSFGLQLGHQFGEQERVAAGGVPAALDELRGRLAPVDLEEPPAHRRLGQRSGAHDVRAGLGHDLF